MAEKKFQLGRSLDSWDFYYYLFNKRGFQEGVLINGGPSTHICTQTSPSPSQSSTNLTWGSDSCPSPYLASISDHDCVDEESSTSSAEVQHGSLVLSRLGLLQPELSTKSSSAPVLKKVSTKVSNAIRA